MKVATQKDLNTMMIDGLYRLIKELTQELKTTKDAKRKCEIMTSINECIKLYKEKTSKLTLAS